ncbi:hypothetical protein [Wolbachia endosymbiont (group A) of Anomoia purmunda]|uniref:hypothetical protein n=1 Tax=Wolbachia endosymbiont (group A) of Anomoia purmunda TaxID=2953978 RepID=UPI00223136B9|nr:hypothetical protein [Wolbachia endosymbiont (group A) of Anomoia purmunda]
MVSYELVIPLRVSGIYTANESTTVRTLSTRRVSSQCLTLGSRNFIKLVSIKVAVLC